MQEPGHVAQGSGHESREVQASSDERAGDLVIPESESGWLRDGLREGFVFVVLLRRNMDQG